MCNFASSKQKKRSMKKNVTVNCGNKRNSILPISWPNNISSTPIALRMKAVGIVSNLFDEEEY